MANEALKIDRMKEDLIKQEMKKLHLVGGKDLRTRAELLNGHFVKILNDPAIKVEMALCQTCGGKSPAEYDICPFCGDDGGVVDNEGKQITPPKDAKPAIEAAGEEAPVPGDEEEGDEDDGDEETEPASVADPSKTSIEVKDEREKQLDDMVGVYWKHREEFGITGYKIAEQVKAMFDAEIWTARTKDGKRAYSTFQQFVSAELRVSRSHVYYMIAIAQKYSAEDIKGVGSGSLRWLVKLEGDGDRKLLEEVKEGKLSARDLEDMARGKQGRIKTKGKGVTPEVAAKAKAEKSKALSVMVTAPEKAVFQMFASGSFGKNKPPQPAKDLASDPWIEEVHENGVTTRYQVKLNAKTGVVELHVSRRRGAAAVPAAQKEAPAAKPKKAAAKKAKKKSAKK